MLPLDACVAWRERTASVVSKVANDRPPRVDTGASFSETSFVLNRLKPGYCFGSCGSRARRYSYQ